MSTDNNIFQLPAEIDLLFDNKKLDVLIYLGILYHLKKSSRKRQFSLAQLLYYYSVIYFESHKTNTPLIYKYLRDEKIVNEVMIYLDNLQFVKIHGDIFTPINRLKVSITQEGIKAIDSLESDSVKIYLENISIIIRNFPYEIMSTRFRHLLYEGEF